MRNTDWQAQVYHAIWFRWWDQAAWDVQLSSEPTCWDCLAAAVELAPALVRQP